MPSLGELCEAHRRGVFAESLYASKLDRPSLAKKQHSRSCRAHSLRVALCATRRREQTDGYGIPEIDEAGQAARLLTGK